MELYRKTEKQELEAMETFNQGNELSKSVVALLKKVNYDGQLPLYYSGGFRMLRDTLTGGDVNKAIYQYFIALTRQLVAFDSVLCRHCAHKFVQLY